MAADFPRKGQLCRSDLLEAIASDNSAAANYLAEQLGLVETIIRAPVIESVANVTLPDFTIEAHVVDQSIKPSMGFWRLEHREQTTQKQPDNQLTKTRKRLGWSERPETLPVFHPITSPSALLPRLLHHLKHQRTIRAIDADAVVKKLGRGEYLQRIPRLKRRSLGRHLLVIEDRHLHLIPYWHDQTLFSRLLASYLPDYAYSHAILLEDRDVPQAFSINDQLQDWVLPPDNSVVVVFSDLGALSEYAENQVQCWLSIGRQLLQRGCKLLAVTPCHPDMCDPRLNTLFTLVPWEPSRQLIKQDFTVLRAQADQLLMLLAPVVRLEPGLLRSVRLAVSQHGMHFNASVEAAVWQHPDLLEPSSIAATFSSVARNRWLAEFKAVPEHVKKTVLDTIRPWRAELQEHIWFEEITSLDAQSRCLIPSADLDDANDYFQHLAQRYDSNNLEEEPDDNTRHWILRVEKRLPQQSSRLPEVGESLQRIVAKTHEDDIYYRADFPIDPANLIADDLPQQTLNLYQTGEQLIAELFADDAVIGPGSSRLASLRYRNGLIYFKPWFPTIHPQQIGSNNSLNKKDFDDSGQSVKFKANERQQDINICSLPDVPGLMLRSDEETLYFSQIQRPQWASNLARDRYGLYAELDIKDITQRLRWIEPGTFLMGSPENEPERYSDENQHQVTLTNGFWMADSTVTQQLWQAVMGNNPSKFDDDLNNSVENVSWDDAQQFIKIINQLIPDAQARLPSEAQWEYACRAGTTTPFSFGGNISAEQVNYDGNHPYADGKKEQYRQRTVVVKSLLVNPWGLYEMHGNVWEWCEDIWLENLGSESVTDPLQQITS